jgi:hypothetical protein
LDYVTASDSEAVSAFDVGDCFGLRPRNDIFILVVVPLGLSDSFDLRGLNGWRLTNHSKDPMGHG